jgi:hypothetical protein
METALGKPEASSFWGEVGMVFSDNLAECITGPSDTLFASDPYPNPIF